MKKKHDKKDASEEETMVMGEEPLQFPEDEEESSEKADEASEEAAEASDESGETEVSEENVKEDGAEDAASEEDASAKELAEMKDRYMRLLAEYDNFRRRTQKEKENIYADAIAEVVKEWLPLVDDIERAVASSESMDENSVEKVAEGIKLIGKQAVNVLGKLGVEEISSGEGETFDPNLHEAVMHVEDDSLPEQAIAQVFQKGYSCRGRVIRHSVVKVAN
ncbi:MAG: nucleotide exchange factor GrpE [Clostridiales bacterium]|nr:nucleotide exchange factor GrpE [Clostridiales bacterium]